jgi:microcystin degradation protein MlrC
MTARVGILAIGHESHAFAPGRTTLEDFRSGVLRVGREMEADWEAGSQSPMAGAVEVFRGAGMEAVPILHAYATPGPVIAREAGEALWAMAQEELARCGNLDAVFVVPHGAAMAEGRADFDGWWLGELRRLVGPEVPVAGAMDPHCHVTEAKAQAVDFLLPYRTNPHLDARERGAKAARLLVRRMREGVRVVQRFCLPPVLFNIESQHTGTEPLAGLCRACEAMEGRAGILDASVVLGYPYGDLPEMGSGIQVVAETPEAAREAALELGRRLWEAREGFEPKLVAVEEAMARLETLERPACLLDMGDNIGGGGTGRGTWLAAALAGRAQGKSFVCLCDAEAARRAIAAGAGAAVELSLGGGGQEGPVLDFRGTVVRIPPERYRDSEPRHGGRTEYSTGPAALCVSADGRLHVLITSERASPNSPGLLTNAGLDPAEFDVIVAKGVNGPIGAFEGICRTFLKVDTPGLTSANLGAFPFPNRRRPMYPFERDCPVDWDSAILPDDS